MHKKLNLFILRLHVLKKAVHTKVRRCLRALAVAFGLSQHLKLKLLLTHSWREFYLQGRLPLRLLAGFARLQLR